TTPRTVMRSPRRTSWPVAIARTASSCSPRASADAASTWLGVPQVPRMTTGAPSAPAGLPSASMVAGGRCRLTSSRVSPGGMSGHHVVLEAEALEQAVGLDHPGGVEDLIGGVRDEADLVALDAEHLDPRVEG